MSNKRFIEVSFPLKEVSKISAKEKKIRHGHISTLHIWWARRPLAASRATAYAALINAPENIDEWQEKMNFIVELSKWENSNNRAIIKRAREEILKVNGGKPPKVIDPFAGGGSYPLEALRLGCETYSSDYNPVAVLIEKATLEYPQKYGKPFEGMPPLNNLHLKNEIFTYNLYKKHKSKINPLCSAIEIWSNWVLEKAKKKLSEFYKPLYDEIPIGYFWARTIPCQNPSCNVEIPLIRNYWLVKKYRKKIALHPISNGPGREINFEIVAQNIQGYNNWPSSNFNPSEGTVSRANARCPACGAMIDDEATRNLFKDGKSRERMIAVVYSKPNTYGKFYRLATQEDLETYEKAQKALEKKIIELRDKWLMEPIPDEDMNQDDPTTVAGRGYGIRKWGDLFNFRQKLSLLVFTEAVREAYDKMVSLNYPKDFSNAIIVYLGILVNNIVEKNNTICRWANTKETIAGSFSRQVLPMVWDFFESCPLCNSTGGWYGANEYNIKVIKFLSQILKFQQNIPIVTQSSATVSYYSENNFDAVLTDPPYYDNVSYAALSDFFYVWFKRTIGHHFPEYFATPLTPKSGEIIANVPLHKDREKAKKFFEEQLALSFKEMYRILKPNGVAVIVYAHKSTAGWETVINALLDSGLVVTASWPINTEMESRLNANQTASLASSIYIVARKLEREKIGFYNEVKGELEKYMTKKLDKLWAEGISGADFFISAIGAGIEVFGKYEKVIDYSENPIRADAMLEDIRKLATDYAVNKILQNGFANEINELTRYYVLYRWEYGEAKVHFDEARKLATSVGIDLANEWNRRNTFIKKEKEFIRVLGPQSRDLDSIKDSNELIDVLHHILILWEQGKRAEMVKRLKTSGFGSADSFYRVAQAVAESLPQASKEKKLLEGFLTGRERIQREITETKTIQGELEL